MPADRSPNLGGRRPGAGRPPVTPEHRAQTRRGSPELRPRIHPDLYPLAVSLGGNEWAKRVLEAELRRNPPAPDAQLLEAELEDVRKELKYWRALAQG